MSVIVAGIIAWAVSQSIKLLLFLARGGKLSWGSIVWIYLWIGKFPSSHSALLSAAIYTIWRQEGASPLFGFSVMCAAIFIFTLAEDRKRYELMKKYYVQSADPAISSIVSDGTIDEFEGHTLREILAGILVGLAVASLIALYA